MVQNIVQAQLIIYIKLLLQIKVMQSDAMVQVNQLTWSESLNISNISNEKQLIKII